MKRVTLTIEDKGGTETYTAEGAGPWVLPLVLRLTNAAIGAHSEEISALTAAARIITDVVQACAESSISPSRVPEG